MANLGTSLNDDAAELDVSDLLPISDPADPASPVTVGALDLTNVDYVELPDVLELAAPTFSISLWVNPAAAAPGGLVSRTVDTGRYTFNLALDGGGIPYVLFHGETTNTEYKLAGQDDAPANQWTFLTAQFDGAILTLYMNGRLSASLDLSTAEGIVSVDSPAASGAGPVITRVGEGYAGLISQLSFYAPLSAQQIFTLYRGTLADPAILSYAFNDGGVTAGDSAHTSDYAEDWRHAGVPVSSLSTTPVVPGDLEWRQVLGTTLADFTAGTDMAPRYDQDADGLTLAQEDVLGTRPDRADTDDDGRNDGEEYSFTASSDGTPPQLQHVRHERERSRLEYWRSRCGSPAHSRALLSCWCQAGPLKCGSTQRPPRRRAPYSAIRFPRPRRPNSACRPIRHSFALTVVSWARAVHTV